MAILLQIPSQNTKARETLEVEFNQLILHGTERGAAAGAGGEGNRVCRFYVVTKAIFSLNDEAEVFRRVF